MTGMIAPTAERMFASVGRRYFDGAWFREDPAMTLYCHDRDDISPVTLLSSYDKACYLCRAGIPHTTALHDKLRYMPDDEQVKLYGEV